MIRLAFLYSALLMAIVVIADAGWLPHLADRVHHLPYCDKLLHFLLFGVLALVVNLALASSGHWRLSRAIVIGCILVLIVATAEEYSNRFFPRRDWSLSDLAANYLGVVTVGLLPLWGRPPERELPVAAGPDAGQVVAAAAADDSFGPQNAGQR